LGIQGDFLSLKDLAGHLQHKGRIWGLEVKSAAANKLKSLFSFAQAVPDSLLIRIYSGPLKEEKIEISENFFGLLSLPFYLVSRTMED
jgi:hypothetical protein